MIKHIVLWLFIAFIGIIPWSTQAEVVNACQDNYRHCQRACAGRNTPAAKMACSNSCQSQFNSCFSNGGSVLLASPQNTTKAAKNWSAPKPKAKTATKARSSSRTSTKSSNATAKCDEQIQVNGRWVCNNGSGASGYSAARDSNAASEMVGPPAPSDTEIFQRIVEQSAQVCMQQVAQFKQVCEEKHASAKDSCDEEDSSMSEIGRAASQITQGAGAMSASSVAMACSKAADLIAGANAALAGWRINCKSNRSNCISSCETVTKEIEQCVNQQAQIAGTRYASMGGASNFRSSLLSYFSESDFLTDSSTKRRECVAMETKIQEAERAIVNYAGTLTNAQQCKELSAAAVPDICKANPTMAGCAATGPVDCSSPQNASNKICICQKNPLDPTCKTGSSEKAGFDQRGSGAGSNSAGYGGAGSDALKSDFSSKGIDVAGGAPKATSGDAASAGGGSGIGGGGGSGLGGAGDEAGAYDSASEEPDINAGFYGAAGSSGGPNFGGGGGADGALDEASLGDQNVYDGLRGAPDLRQFLPDGTPNPNFQGQMAGVYGPDGITGPHTNIWNKISNRYKEKEPTLIKD